MLQTQCGSCLLNTAISSSGSSGRSLSLRSWHCIISALLACVPCVADGCLQADVEGVQCVYGIVHILAYGDITQQPWQDLRAADCLHFIQLAQCALEYMLQQATTVHTALVRILVAQHEEFCWNAIQ